MLVHVQAFPISLARYRRRRSLTVCVRAGVQLQVLHVFAVQLHVEFLQGVVPLPQSRLQSQDALHMLLHQAGLFTKKYAGLKVHRPTHSNTDILIFWKAWCMTGEKARRHRHLHLQESLPSNHMFMDNFHLWLFTQTAFFTWSRQGLFPLTVSATVLRLWCEDLRVRRAVRWGFSFSVSLLLILIRKNKSRKISDWC